MRNRLFRYLPAIALCCMSFGCSKLGSLSPADKDSGAQLKMLQAQVEDLERRVGRTEDFIALSISKMPTATISTNASGIRLQTCLPGMAGSRLAGAACT